MTTGKKRQTASDAACQKRESRSRESIRDHHKTADSSQPAPAPASIQYCKTCGRRMKVFNKCFLERRLWHSGSRRVRKKEFRKLARDTLYIENTCSLTVPGPSNENLRVGVRETRQVMPNFGWCRIVNG